MVNVKKVVIWSLVLVNVFFLGAYLLQLYKDHRGKAEALSNLSDLLRENGIYIDSADIEEDGVMPVLTAARDDDTERKIARTLLGQTDLTEQGGINSTYTGDGTGQAVFRAGGTFDVSIHPGVYKITGAATSTTKRLLRQMDIDYISVDTTENAAGETVTAVCAFKKEPIYNCRITLVYKDGWLTEMSGRYASTIKATSDKSDMSSASTALIRFLNDVKKEKFDCAQIYSVRPGYNLSSHGDRVSPVWRIAGDTGVFYVDAQTGLVELDADYITDENPEIP